MIELLYPDSVTLQVETMAPETSIITLRSPQGFPDAIRAGAVLAGYATQVGLHISWTEPEVTPTGDEEVHTYRDPDEGANASVSLIFRGNTLIGMQLSLAL